MGKLCALVSVLAISCVAQASWYWPFGSDEDEKEVPRISTLMEPASRLIDEASDLAGDGKTDEAVKKYRRALAELNRIEQENPERAKSAEFATLRNKRAYVSAAIDSMLLSQVKANDKAVAVSDTADLEKKLAEERAKDKPSAARPSGVEARSSGAKEAEPATAKKPATQNAKPKTKREQAMFDIANGDYAAAEIVIGEMLAAKPNNAMALNLKATMEARQGKFKEAERTLDQAINSNPRSHFAYYNMAILMLQVNPDNTSPARRYYETGRTYGGPKDETLEALLK